MTVPTIQDQPQAHNKANTDMNDKSNGNPDNEAYAAAADDNNEEVNTNCAHNDSAGANANNKANAKGHMSRPTLSKMSITMLISHQYWYL